MPEPVQFESTALKLRLLASAMESCGDDDRYESLRERYEELTERILSRPIRSWAQVIEIAEIAHFWADKTSEGELLALESPCEDDRVAAELIEAVLAMSKGGVNA